MCVAGSNVLDIHTCLWFALRRRDYRVAATSEFRLLLMLFTFHFLLEIVQGLSFRLEAAIKAKLKVTSDYSSFEFWLGDE